MQTNQIEPVTKTAEYLELVPILASMKMNNDRRPKSSLPVETEGSPQENNSHLLPPVSLYNAHGILTKTNPNSLVGYA
jgi:hypothetical protein